MTVRTMARLANPAKATVTVETLVTTVVVTVDTDFGGVGSEPRAPFGLQIHSRKKALRNAKRKGSTGRIEKGGNPPDITGNG